MKTQWSATPPTKDGLYWFYGWPYGETDSPPEWHPITVMVTPTGILYALGNGFWDPKHEKAHGKFTKVVFPPPPELKS